MTTRRWNLAIYLAALISEKNVLFDTYKRREVPVFF